MILYIKSLYGTKHFAKQTRILHKQKKIKQNKIFRQKNSKTQKRETF